jgi:hypothetical protein
MWACAVRMSVIPCMRFLMTPLNQRLSQPDHPVRLGKGSKIREVLKRMAHIMFLAQARTAHITVVVPPHLPHNHGTLDAAAIGAGGVWLPGTHFIWLTIWHLKWPPNIELAVWEGRLSMADCKSWAYFVQECLLDHLLNGQVAGVSTHNFSDNTPTVSRITHHRRDATLPRHMAAHHRERPGRLHLLAGQGKPHGQHPVEVLRGGLPQRNG